MDEQGSRPTRSQRAPRSRRRAHPPKKRTLSDLRPLVKQGLYRIGNHAAKHATCEGFTESDIVQTVLYGRELMRYWEDQRLLVLGYLPVSASVKIPLHVVVEYSGQRWVDVVTAFIPHDPHRVPSRARLAEVLRYDRDQPESRLVGRGGAR